MVLFVLSASADIYKYDIGNKTSAVQEGFIRVVPGVKAGEGGASFLSKSPWTEYEFLEFSIFTESSRTNLPNVPLGVSIYMPDRKNSFNRQLKELKTGQWTDFKIPLKELSDPAQCSEMQFSLSESEYKDGDVVDFWIDGMILTGDGKKPYVLDDGTEPAAKRWSPAEATCTADGKHAKTGKTALRLHVDIDWKSGEKKYPVGWPRMSRGMPGGISVRDRAYEKYEEDHNQRSVPPPVWTCPLSQDSAVGDHPAEFKAAVKPGRYNAWILCGVSQHRRSQFYNFEISHRPVREPVPVSRCVYQGGRIRWSGAVFFQAKQHVCRLRCSALAGHR